MLGLKVCTTVETRSKNGVFWGEFWVLVRKLQENKSGMTSASSKTVFSIFMRLFIHHHYIILEHFHQSLKESKHPLAVIPYSPPPSKRRQSLIWLLPLWSCLLQAFRIDRFVSYVAFCAWHSIMFLKLTSVARASISFFIVWIAHLLFIYSLAGWL